MGRLLRAERTQIGGVLALPASLFLPAAADGVRVHLFVRPEHSLQHLVDLSGGTGRSVRDEPDCFRFDILRDPDIETRFYLYEVYTDESAMQVHMETPHFKRWWATVEDMIDDIGSIKMDTVFPSDLGWASQKPGLQNW